MKFPVLFVVVCSLAVVTPVVASANSDPGQDVKAKAYSALGPVVTTAHRITRRVADKRSKKEATATSDKKEVEVFDDTDGMRVETGVDGDEHEGPGRQKDRDAAHDVGGYDISMTVELQEGLSDSGLEVIERALRRIRNHIANCYEDVADQQRGLEGEAHLVVTIADTGGNRGTIEDVEKSEEPQLSDDVAQCIVRELTTRRIGRVPPPDSNDETTEAVVEVTYEFERRKWRQPELKDDSVRTSE